MLNSLIKKKTILDKSLIKLIKQQVDLIHQPEPQLYIKNIQIDNNLYPLIDLFSYSSLNAVHSGIALVQFGHQSA